MLELINRLIFVLNSMTYFISSDVKYHMTDLYTLLSCEFFISGPLFY